MIIAIDFDGTIARTNYPEILGEQPYAAQVITQLKEHGHYIIIWTCRTGKPLLDAINWLLEHGIPFDRVNDHDPESVSKYGDHGKKIHAECYIDDQNLGGFPGWQEVYQLIIQREIDERCALENMVYP